MKNLREAFQKLADSAFEARIALTTFRVIYDTRDGRFLPGITDQEKGLP